uniref:ImpB/MucB/SamB family protein Y family DNA polymerase n=1 Tax=Streptococcus suis TaxID=1307 RepID=A0A6B9RI50_STRSU|nr:ImpB/MucB/SamB family protein Y family DNA polymerase [Streptococcus suis]
MGYIDYSFEPQSDIAFLDMKSFYASVECVDRGLHPLYTSLCVMSRADNSAGLILASSPMFKKVFGKANVGRSYDLPFDINTRKFSYQNGLRGQNECHLCMSVLGNISTTLFALSVDGNISIGFAVF